MRKCSNIVSVSSGAVGNETSAASTPTAARIVMGLDAMKYEPADRAEMRQLLRWFSERAAAARHLATLSKPQTFEHGYKVGVCEAYDEAAHMIATSLNRLHESDCQKRTIKPAQPG